MSCLKKVKPKGRLKKQTVTTTNKTEYQSPRLSSPKLFFQLLLSVFSLIVINCASSVSIGNETSSNLRQYHANLPKLGLISGLSIDLRGPQASSSVPSSEGEGPHQVVVGFLGIPYAAPPVGPLRFMPPGAPQQQQQQQQQQGQQLVIMPGGQLAPVRPFNRPGLRCVHLADWLNHSISGSSSSSNNDHNHHQDNNQDQFLFPSREFQRQQQQQRRRQQSEDCLNLNVFVPIEKSIVKQQTITIGQQQQQQQHSIGGSKSDRQLNEQQQPANHAQFSLQGHSSGHQRTAATSIGSGSPAAQQVHSASWPLLDGSQQRRKLPVLVLVQAARAIGKSAEGTQEQTANRPMDSSSISRPRSRPIDASNEANDQAKTALLADSIVITFNYRTGLLGFLPYSDTGDNDDNGPGTSGNNKNTRHQSPPARYNHAIWDQIGLLHWIKRNVHAFGGDPSNITLAAADNRANLYVQLLCMSPLAKGLFSRALLLQRQRGCGHDTSNQVDLNQLIEVVGQTKAPEMRRRLSGALAEIVIRLNLTSHQSENPFQPNVYEAILSADIYQLAQIDHELNQKLSNKLLPLINEPSLDDTLLFPHLRPLIDHMIGGSGNALLKSLQAELNYCSYMRRIYKTLNSNLLEDPLQLIPSVPSSSSSSSSANFQGQNWTLKLNDSLAQAGWHREVGSILKPVVNNSNQQSSLSSRSMAVQYFNHLHYLNSLNRILTTTNNKQHHQRLADDGAASDDVEDQANGRRRGHDLRLIDKRDPTISSMRRDHEAMKRPPPSLGESKSIEETNHLAGLLSSVDIMFGYISCSSSRVATYADDLGKSSYHLARSNSNFSKLAENLSNEFSNYSSILDNNLLTWLKWIDLHGILSAGAAHMNKGGLIEYCDFSSSSSSITSSANEKLTSSSSVSSKNSFIFIALNNDDDNFTSHNEDSTTTSLLLRTIQNTSDKIQSGVRNFLKYGDTNPHNNEELQQGSGSNNNIWISYSTLSREFEPVQLEEEEYKSMRNQMRIQLDIVPYLIDELPKQQQQNHQSIIDNPKNPLYSLYNCLGDLESELDNKPATTTTTTTGNISASSRKCLNNSLAKLRILTRRYAAQDLEPLIFKLNNNQMWEFGSSEKSSGTSLITTRNLVNQLSNLEDTLGETTAIELGDMESHVHNLIVNNGSSGSKSAQTSLNDNNNSKSFLLRNFLGITFKDTVGRALTIVVVTGLVIFLVNLIIVIVMTLRSSRQRRTTTNQSQEAGAQRRTTNSNKICDSESAGPSNSVAIVGKSILHHQQIARLGNQGNDQSLDDCCWSDSTNKEALATSGAPMKLASSLRKVSNSTSSNGFIGGGGSFGDCDGAKNNRPPRTKQLKFDLADHNNEPEDLPPAGSDDSHFEQQEHVASNHFDEHLHHHDHQMIELSDLMDINNGHHKHHHHHQDDNDSKLILNTSPLLDAQYCFIETPSHHHHEHPSNDCSIHHRQTNHYDLSNNHHPLDLNEQQQYVAATRDTGSGGGGGGELVHSPFNHSLTTTSNTTSSTFRHSSGSIGGLRKVSPAVDFNLNNLVCSSHSPNSSTTLSMTPNQQIESSIMNLIYPQNSQQFNTILDVAYHHQHQCADYHSHHSGQDSSFEIAEQGLSKELSESKLFNTLKRQRKFPAHRVNPVQNNYEQGSNFNHNP